MNVSEITHLRKTLRLKEEHWCIWEVKNFQCNSSQLVHQIFESPTFFTGKSDEYEWVLRAFTADFCSNKNSNYVGFQLLLTNYKKFDHLFFVARVSIIDEAGRRYLKKSALLTQGSSGQSVFKNFILKQTLLNDPRLLSNGRLRIHCEISNHSHEKIHFLKKVQSDKLGKILNSEKYSDFKFAVGAKEFNVHRAILASQSPVFEAMFDSNMRESNEGKVDIVDVEAKVMEKLLRFVYVGELMNIEDFADKLLIAAEKYQLNELKQLCEDIIIKQLSLTNVYDILCLADENMAENLKENTVEFFHRNAKSLGAHKDFKAHINALPGHLKTDIIGIFVDKL